MGGICCPGTAKAAKAKAKAKGKAKAVATERHRHGNHSAAFRSAMNAVRAKKAPRRAATSAGGASAATSELERREARRNLATAAGTATGLETLSPLRLAYRFLVLAATLVGWLLEKTPLLELPEEPALDAHALESLQEPLTGLTVTFGDFDGHDRILSEIRHGSAIYSHRAPVKPAG